MTSSRQQLTDEQRQELIAAQIMNLLPTPFVRALGAYMGKRAAKKAIKEQQQWTQNIRANLSKLKEFNDPIQQEKYILKWTSYIGTLHSEIVIIQRLVKENLLEITGKEYIDSAKSPLILTTCHLGNWELIGHLLSKLPNPTSVLYAPQANPVYHHFALKARSSWHPPLDLIPASSQASSQLIKALKQGNNLLIFIDEKKNDFIWSPSLGRQLPYAGNRWLAARLAVRYQVDIVPLYVHKIDQARYRIVIEQKLEKCVDGGQNQEIDWADQLNERLNTLINTYLDQWYWLGELDLDKPLPG